MATYTSNYGWTKPSGSDNVDISVLNDNLDDQDSTIHDAFLNMAPPFSESSTYAVDDIVLYGTGLYKCHTAVVTPGAWTGSTNWQVYKLSEGGSGGGGTSNYNQLTNKPSINGVTLSGNKTTSDLGLQDELTFDNVPTDGSNNPVKSDGVYDSEKDIYAVMGKMGAKNLIPYPYAFNSQTISAVAFTVNDDGTIEANGTASADITFHIHYRGNVQESAPCIIKNGKYIFTGCQSNGGLSTFRLGVGRTYNNAWQTLGEDFGTGCYVTLNGDDYSPDNVHLAIVIIIKKNAVLSNVVFKPMLRLATDTDDTYQPYAKTNRELTDEIATKTKNFQGTIAEWNQLSTAEKKAYDHASITDSIDGGVTFPANKVVMTGGGNVEDTLTNVTSGTFTAAENVTVLHSKVKKQLNIVSIDIFVQKNLTANQWNHVGDIPANFAPDTYNIYFPGLNDTDVGFFESRIQATSIDVYPTVSGTKNFSLVTTYITTN